MSDSNHSIPDKARPVRINANKSGMWAGMDAGAIESNFYILERQPSDTILDTGMEATLGADTGDIEEFC